MVDNKSSVNKKRIHWYSLNVVVSLVVVATVVSVSRRARRKRQTHGATHSQKASLYRVGGGAEYRCVRARVRCVLYRLLARCPQKHACARATAQPKRWSTAHAFYGMNNLILLSPWFCVRCVSVLCPHTNKKKAYVSHEKLINMLLGFEKLFGSIRAQGA